MSRERLREAVSFLPLDQWQSAAVARGIDRLSEEEAKEIAIELEEAVSELPDILDEFDTAFGEAITDLNTSDYGNFSRDRQPQTDASLLEVNTQLNEETDASELIAAAIFYTRSQINEIKRQLIEEKNIPDRDIYIASVEEENSQPIIKLPQNLTPVEIDSFFVLWLLSGFLIGIGLDVLYFGMSTLSASYGGIPAIFILFISPIIVGSIYIFKSLQTSIALKKSLIEVYRNHLHAGEFLLVVKIPDKSGSSIHILLEELGGVEVKVIGKKSSSPPLEVLSSSRR
jgi:hypothetical protein